MKNNMLVSCNDIKNTMMVSCNVASQATTLSMGSLELLLRASVFAILDLNEMSGTTLPREILWASLSGLVSCGWCWGSASGRSNCRLRSLSFMHLKTSSVHFKASCLQAELLFTKELSSFWRFWFVFLVPQRQPFSRS